MCWSMWIKLYVTVLVFILAVRSSMGSYDCLCNYMFVDALYPVFSKPDSSLRPIGYLYKYNCKPLKTLQLTISGYFIIQFEHQVGYVQEDQLNNLIISNCTGDVPTQDQVTDASIITSVTPELSKSTGPTTKATVSSPTTLQYLSTVKSTENTQPEASIDTKQQTVSTNRIITPTLSLPESTPPSLVSTPPSIVSTPPSIVSTPPSIVTTPPSIVSTKIPSGSTMTSTLVTPTKPSGTTVHASISWPAGTYGLMEPVSGCPDDGYVTWSEGWRFQDTEGLLPFVSDGNTFSNGIAHYVRGSFQHNDIKTYFCMKTSHISNQYDHDWPQGSYCILKYGSCPTGFSSGSIFWDDVVQGNNNDKGGTLPEGIYGEDTTIYYCCRNDGSVNIPIILPTTKPFILLRYGAACQSVQGMNVLDIIIHWDDQNVFNSDKVSGMHPYDDGDGSNHRLHFCHYT